MIGVALLVDALMEVPASTSAMTSGVIAQTTRTMTTPARDARMTVTTNYIIII